MIKTWQSRMGANILAVEGTFTTDAMQAAIDELRAENAAVKQALSNLLARIHRDGGHYQAEHGDDTAIMDADIKVANLYAENANLKTQIKSDEALMQGAMELIADVFDEEKIDVPTLNMLRTRLENKHGS